MGKRELVLVAGFLVLGIIVYQFTAPPPPPGQEGVSVGGIFQRIKREVQGSRESATAQSRESIVVDPGVRLVRMNFLRNNDLTIVGTDGDRLEVEMQVTARGYQQAEAKAAADAAKVKIDRSSDAITLSAFWPQRTSGSEKQGFITDGTIKVTLPRRLQLRLEPHAGDLTIEDVAAVEIMGSRGDTRIARSAGAVTLSHSSGKLEIDGAGSIKLTARSSNGTIKNVTGTFTMDVTSGDLEIQNVAGPFEVEARNTELVFDAAKLARPPFRYNGVNGSMRVQNLKTESRIDGRNVDLEIEITAAAPITVYSTGEDITIDPPPGGYAIDAVATEGRLSIDDGNLKPGGEGEQRMSGSIRGGGPELTLRATRGDIRVRKAESK